MAGRRFMPSHIRVENPPTGMSVPTEFHPHAFRIRPDRPSFLPPDAASRPRAGRRLRPAGTGTGHGAGAHHRHAGCRNPLPARYRSAAIGLENAGGQSLRPRGHGGQTTLGAARAQPAESRRSLAHRIFRRAVCLRQHLHCRSDRRRHDARPTQSLPHGHRRSPRRSGAAP